MKLWKTLLGTAFLLCLLTTLSASPVFGAEIVDTGPCGDDLTYTLDSDGLLTISGTGPMWDYERSTVNYYLYSTAPWGKSSITSLQIDPGVSAIGQYAFFGPADIDRYATKSTLSSVSLPEGLLSIGDFAFGYCDKLTSIAFPSSLINIGSDAFYGCRQMQHFYIPSITSWLSLSGDISSLYRYYSFYEGETYKHSINLYLQGELISELTIPDGITHIRDYAFFRCKNLTSVTFPDSLVSIGADAFRKCTNLSSIKLPDNSISIGSNALFDCEDLVNFYITDIETWLSLSGDITSIYEYHEDSEAGNIMSKSSIDLFLDDQLLTDLKFPDGITHIRSYAFMHTSLTAVTFPDTLVSIGYAAFRNCTDLTSITLPEWSSTQVSIQSEAFYNCPNLTNIYLSDITAWLSLSGDLQHIYKYFDKENGNTKTKNMHLFLNDKLITDLVIPKGTSQIHNYAFYAVNDLTSISFPESLEAVGSYAFYNCTSLTKVVFAGKPKSIESYAFSNCSGLTSVAFPEGIENIGARAFYNCSKLMSITFPDGVVSIGSYAFSSCTNLASLTFSGGPKNIDPHAFYGCTSLTDFHLDNITVWLTFPESFDPLTINDLEKRIYLQDELLTHLIIPEGITNIRSNAFYNYSKLTSVTVPDGVNSIAKNAFYGCSNLKIMTLPQGLTSISNDSFKNCSSLTDLIFLGAPPAIDSTAFPSLTLTVYHPEDGSWTDDVKLNYGGSLTYKPLGIPSSLQMTLSDSYPYYFTDDALTKENMITTLTYSGGAVSRLHPTQYELKADDMTTPGAKTVTISTEGLSTSYAVFVHNGHRIENIPQTWPESSHDHPNNADDIQTLYIPGANLIQITFDQRTALEPWYDFLYVYDANDTQIAQFTGTKAAGLTLAVPGDTVKLRLTSDAATANWGYALTDVSASWMEHEFNSDSGTCSICDNYCAHTYAEGAVITAPWCEISGEQAYTCTQCGYCKTETIPALGHSYENGMCSNCGAIDFDNVTDPGLKLGYPTLSFEDEIVYNIYFYVTDPTNVAELGLMTLSEADRYATIEDATATIPGYVTNGTMYLVKTNGIPAAHMGDTLYFKVYAKLTDGSYAYSVLGGYNAKTYADTMLDGDYPDAMKSLVVSMLNYGAEAQRYFGHNTDALVDSTLTDAQKAMIRAFDSTMVDAIAKLDPSKIKGFTRNDGDFRTLYPSVSFDGAFAINLYCGPTVTVDDVMTLYWWDAETADTADRLTLDNATGSAPMDLVLTDWWGQLPGIAAKDISKTYYLTCVFTSDGETITTGIIPYSLGKYCAGKADAEGDPQQAFSQATAVYGYYAKNYFASIT